MSATTRGEVVFCFTLGGKIKGKLADPIALTMDVWTGSNAAAAALLTLPRSDWVDATTGGATATGAATSASATATATTTSTAKPLVLLQLPAGWTAQHLQGSSLVVHKHASLVSERQGCTYAVHTVETSNASVLVRPPKTETEEPGENGEAEGADDDDRHSNDNSNEQSPTKRRKLLPLVDGTVSRVVDARLLRPSGSSFLELRPRPLDARALEKVLDVHCPHNGSNDAVGQTVLQLARRLPASFREVRDGLRSVLAYPLPSPLQASVNPPPRFVRLSEQARHEAAEAIVAALHELGMDYAGSEGGIGNVNAFIQHVLARQSDDERFHDNVEEAERVLRFALYELRDDHVIEDCDSQVAFDRWLKFLLGSQGSDASQDGAPTSMRLSVRKVRSSSNSEQIKRLLAGSLDSHPSPLGPSNPWLPVRALPGRRVRRPTPLPYAIAPVGSRTPLGQVAGGPARGRGPVRRRHLHAPGSCYTGACQRQRNGFDGSSRSRERSDVDDRPATAPSPLEVRARRRLAARRSCPSHRNLVSSQAPLDRSGAAPLPGAVRHGCEAGHRPTGALHQGRGARGRYARQVCRPTMIDHT